MSAAQIKSNNGNGNGTYKYLLGVAGALLLLFLTFFGYAVQDTKAQVNNHESRLSTIEGVQQVEHKGIEKRLDQIEKGQAKIIELLSEVKDAKR